jgi:hypothetical protein
VYLVLVDVPYPDWNALYDGVMGPQYPQAPLGWFTMGGGIHKCWIQSRTATLGGENLLRAIMVSEDGAMRVV